MGEAGRPVAVVTGGARGIGAAICRALAAAGWDLVVGDVATSGTVPELTYPLATAEELEVMAAECRALGAWVATATCDVRDERSVSTLCELAGESLRAAVACAGIIGADGPAWEQSTEDIERDLAVNLHGVANLARAAVPMMLTTEEPARCRFVAVVSSAGDRGLPRLASYVAAKHAALGYVRSLSADLAPYGITANAVLPGSTRTRLLERTAAAYGLPTADEFSRHQRLGRLLDPAEIASSVVWLLSAGASGTTGTSLHVDGGFTG